MGNTADDRLIDDSLRSMLGGQFQLRSADSNRALEKLIDEAKGLAVQDNMSFKDAMRIVSGQTRPPYGTPRPR